MAATESTAKITATANTVICSALSRGKVTPMMMVSSKERSDKRAKHQTSCVVGSSGGNISKKVIERAPPF